MTKIIVWVNLVIASLLADQFYSPSFDCSKVNKGSVEYEICINKELSKLDKNLSELYIKVKKKYGKNTIKYNQLDWLEERNRCYDISCIVKLYKDRVDFLEDLDSSVTLGEPVKREVWDFELNKGDGTPEYYTSNSNGDVVIINTNRKLRSTEQGKFYVNYLFLKKEFCFKSGEKLNDIVTDFKSIESIFKDKTFGEGPIIKFSDESVLKIKNFKVFGGGYSKKCIPYYGDSYNFQLEDDNGNVLKQKILLVLLDDPISFYVNEYCDNTDFKIMHTAIWHVSPTSVQNLGDDTFLVTPRYININRAHENLNESVYFDDVIRFDKNLNTKSQLIGKKFFWIDLDEYKKVVGNPKSLKDENVALQAWINKKLEKE